MTFNQFCKTSINLQPAKQGLFSLIPEATVHMNFAVDLARFFRTPISCNRYKIDVLKNLAKFTEKHLCWSLFWQGCRPQTCSFIKKTFQHWCFPVNILSRGNITIIGDNGSVVSANSVLELQIYFFFFS